MDRDKDLLKVEILWDGPFDLTDEALNISKGIFLWLDPDGCVRYVSRVYGQSFRDRIEQELQEQAARWNLEYPDETPSIFIGYVALPEGKTINEALVEDVKTILIMHAFDRDLYNERNHRTKKWRSEALLLVNTNGPDCFESIIDGRDYIDGRNYSNRPGSVRLHEPAD